MNTPAETPLPPYYAVIFSSLRTETAAGYEAMALEMLELAATRPGYLGVESARNEVGITVSYWETEAAIRHWKQQSRHRLARQQGREHWYTAYRVRVCKAERAYDFFMTTE